jgi:formate/nitrite transporter
MPTQELKVGASQTLSPSAIPAEAEVSALKKVKQPISKTLILGFLAGVYIAMGGLLSLLIGSGFPEWSDNNPGLQKLLAGAMFPIGLILVVFAGAELFTGNNATLIPGVLNKQYSWGAVAKNWALVWLSNFVGAVFFAYIMVYLTGVIADNPWHSAIIRIAEAKTSMPWHVVFIKGIGANWLVCLAVWLGLSARSAAGKMLGLWFPVMCFVAIGFEHSIANMFFIPSGIFQGADVSWVSFIVNNLIPATLGNIIGGSFFVGGVYWYTYRNFLLPL